MSSKIPVLSLVLVLGTCFAAPKTPLPAHYARWLDQDVACIITDEEKREFLKLTGEEARDRFIADFWEMRNPLRGSKQNPYKEEHYRRLEYATQTFGRRSNTPGWMTDMGRAYILFGKPQSRAPFTSGGQLYPMELWFYSNETGNPSLPPFFYLLFFIPEDIGEYRFYRPSLDGPMKLVRGSNFRSNADVYRTLKQLGGDLAHAAFSLIPSEPIDTQEFTTTMGSDMLINKIKNFSNDTFNVRRLHELRALRATVNSYLLVGENQPLDIESLLVTDPGGRTWLDYAVAINRPELGKSADRNLALGIGYRLLAGTGELIVEDSDERAYPAFETTGATPEFLPFTVANRLPVIPGAYTLEVLITNRETGKIYRGDKKFIVPKTDALTMQGPLIAGSVQQVARPDSATPFQYFGIQFHPAADRKVTRNEPLRALLQLDSGSAAADYEIEYVVVNTQDREMRKSAVDPVPASEFRNGRLLKAKTIPLADLAPGDYRLIATLRAAGSRQPLASSGVPFHLIEASANPSLFFLASSRNLGEPIAQYVRGLEALAQKDEAAGIGYLREAVRLNPANAFASQALVQLYFRGRDWKSVVDLVHATGQKSFESSPDMLAQISLSMWNTGDFIAAKGVLATAKRLYPQSELLRAVAQTVK